MMAVSILIADDDELLRNLLKEVLEEEGFNVYAAADGEEALDIFWDCPEISLVILDIMMPKLDGMQVLEEIRERAEVPVIMLTALGDSASELSSLQNGASDFISKPFHYEILVERVKNLLRLMKVQGLDNIQIGILELDPTGHKVFVRNKEVTLNNKEFQLLELLVLNQNIVLSREKILDRIWGYDYEGDIRTIDTHVKMLRANLGPAGSYIKTIRGVGYLFEEAL
ncbi:MAG: response regulator transcription factor [Clostridium sp.]|nr:response regulator transcription factor [Clostridium sp.]